MRPWRPTDGNGTASMSLSAGLLARCACASSVLLCCFLSSTLPQEGAAARWDEQAQDFSPVRKILHSIACANVLTVVWGARVVNGSFAEQMSVAYHAPDAVVISWATGEAGSGVLAA